MPKIGTLFGELLKLVPRFNFEKAVSTHKADRYSKKFSYQTKYQRSMLELSRVIRETLMDGKSLIDLLSLKPGKLRSVETVPIQASLF